MKKFHRVIKVNQNYLLKPYVDINTKLRQKVKIFLRKINNAFFGKTMENVRKHRNIKLATTEKSYLE